ncbi:hypothetical protein, partial [Salmonella enterica]|uniref:hypothetical protein n=1 Tax=Salmonella enterica TaxID=28901 RepID=UPI003CF4054B
RNENHFTGDTAFHQYGVTAVSVRAGKLFYSLTDVEKPGHSGVLLCLQDGYAFYFSDRISFFIVFFRRAGLCRPLG